MQGRQAIKVAIKEKIILIVQTTTNSILLIVQTKKETLRLSVQI